MPVVVTAGSIRSLRPHHAASWQLACPPGADGCGIGELFHLLGRVHMLGQSWGGMLSLSYTLEHPEAVKSLVLSGTPVSVPLLLQSITATTTGGSIHWCGSRTVIAPVATPR